MTEEKKQRYFSIVVPVYNVEPYLHQCVDSILQQSCNDYELILVDDGSTDNSGNICDTYSDKNEHVIVIHKKNGGLSSARNAGLEIAQGQFVIFLDSDDFWDNLEALKRIKSLLNESEADLLVFNAKRYYEDGKNSSLIINCDVNRSLINSGNVIESIEYMIRNNIYRAAAWNKVIRRSIIQEHNMRFKEGYLSEDMDWCGDLLLYCKKFDYYDSAIYCYRQQRTGSITQGKNEKLVADKLYMCKNGLSQANSLDNEWRRLIGSYYAYEYAVAIGVSGGLKNKDTLLELNDLKILLNFDICNKVKKVNKLNRIFGFYLTRKALCFFVKVK